MISNSILVLKRCVIDRFLLFQIRDTNYEKYSLIVMVKRFSQVLFYTFSGLGDINLRIEALGWLLGRLKAEHFLG